MTSNIATEPEYVVGEEDGRRDVFGSQYHVAAEQNTADLAV